MGGQDTGVLHRGEGAISNSDGCSYVGQGVGWQGCEIRCDNEAVVSIINSLYS